MKKQLSVMHKLATMWCPASKTVTFSFTNPAHLLKMLICHHFIIFHIKINFNVNLLSKYIMIFFLTPKFLKFWLFSVYLMRGCCHLVVRFWTKILTYLSMNKELDLIFKSCSSLDLFMSKSWWECSASFNLRFNKSTDSWIWPTSSTIARRKRMLV